MKVYGTASGTSEVNGEDISKFFGNSNGKTLTVLTEEDKYPSTSVS